MSRKQQSSGKPPRNEYQRRKELEEARKAGTAPPEEDVVTGKLLNPHIPEYISKTPFFYKVEGGSTLIHQHNLKQKRKLDGVHSKQRKGFTGVAASYRKGACENCGAMTHKKKDCFYRPRKKGARRTGEEIMPDEVIAPELDLDYDGKHDRWTGYDPAEHMKLVEEFNKVDQLRREKKAKELMEQLEREGKTVDELDAAMLEEGYVEDGTEAQVGQHFDGKARMTVRNLRLREDTAKYLYNLHSDAHYDPKSRSMREDPMPDVPMDQKPFAGDGWLRSTGEAQKLAEVRQFALHREDLHPLAAPSATELEFKRHKEESAANEKNKLQSVLDRYGGEQYLQAQPKELLMGQTEVYREYAPDGRQIKGPKLVVRTRYEEDVFENNHTAVWGSYWEDFRWGYACCHQMIRNSVCTGERGKEIKQEQDQMLVLQVPDDGKDEHKKKKKKKKKKGKKGKKDKKDKKTKKAKRPATGEVTQEEMEEYRRKRSRRDDPMANYK